MVSVISKKKADSYLGSSASFYETLTLQICINAISARYWLKVNVWNILLSLSGPPIFGNKIQASKYGTFAQTTILNFEVYSLDGVYIVIKDNFNQQKFVVSEIKRQYNISVVIYGRTIYVEGFNVKIKTKPLTRDDFGNYTATAVSRYGNTTYHFTLQSASKQIFFF